MRGDTCQPVVNNDSHRAYFRQRSQFFLRAKIVGIRIDLVDQQGKVIVSEALCNEGIIQLEVSNLSSGIYFLQILDQEAGLLDAINVMIIR